MTRLKKKTKFTFSEHLSKRASISISKKTEHLSKRKTKFLITSDEIKAE